MVDIKPEVRRVLHYIKIEIVTFLTNKYKADIEKANSRCVIELDNSNFIQFVIPFSSHVG